MQRYPNTIVVPETNSAHVNLWCSKGCRNNDNRDFGVFLDMVHLRCGPLRVYTQHFRYGSGEQITLRGRLAAPAHNTWTLDIMDGVRTANSITSRNRI
jgi:hypothetical protein